MSIATWRKLNFLSFIYHSQLLFSTFPVKFKDFYDFTGQKFDLSYLIMPPSYAGRWRVRVEAKAKGNNGEDMGDCLILYVDVEV